MIIKSKINLSCIILISLIITSLAAIPATSVAQTYDSRNYQVKIITLLKDTESKLDLLNQRVKYLQDNYAALNQRVNNLDYSLRTEKQKNAELQNELSLLKQQISKDRDYMKQSLNNAVDKIAKETTKAINSSAHSSYSGNKTFNSNDYYEYKVQPGATLSAIAKAYKVSIDSIRKANNIKNDIIRSGQILYIPKH